MKRYGFVGVIVRHRAEVSAKLQEILSRHSGIILGRLGLPHLAENRLAVIVLIVHATTDELGALSGQLGRLSGVTVKSALEPVAEEGAP